ncbi:hypothetical protein B0H12DRAFT_1097098 [Mycena haematopus]|nr:hypothetical protein B0H12DRAFT_1097098 [Mycena haematopus]
MTRSASKLDFSYDFPVASTSTLAQPRTRSPTRPRWESSTCYDDDDEPDAYAHTHAPQRAHTHPTGNQWQRPPSPPLYPYGADPAYPYTASLLLAPPPPPPRSCDSACSMLSACSSRASKEPSKKKIRKPRRSVDSDAPPTSFLVVASPTTSTSTSSPSPYSSPASSPYSSPSQYDDFDADPEPELESPPHYDLYDDDLPEEAEEPHGPAPSALRKQWAALSLRVRFGVFRAKRRMRARVMSL